MHCQRRKPTNPATNTKKVRQLEPASPATKNQPQHKEQPSRQATKTNQVRNKSYQTISNNEPAQFKKSSGRPTTNPVNSAVDFKHLFVNSFFLVILTTTTDRSSSVTKNCLPNILPKSENCHVNTWINICQSSSQSISLQSSDYWLHLVKNKNTKQITIKNMENN